MAIYISTIKYTNVATYHDMAKKVGKESHIYRPWATGFCPAPPYQKASEVSWEIIVRVVSVFCGGGGGAQVRIG